jgi:hypothetical protein
MITEIIKDIYRFHMKKLEKSDKMSEAPSLKSIKSSK